MKERSGHALQSLQHGIGSRFSRDLILACNEITIYNNMGAPCRIGFVFCARQAQAVFQQPGSVASEGCFSLLLVAEGGQLP